MSSAPPTAGELHGYQPFTLWASERTRAPARFDNRRYDGVPVREKRDQRAATSPETAWNARRRHAPCHIRLPPSSPLDCHFLRLAEEEPYVQRLTQVLAGFRKTAHSFSQVDWALLCLPAPFLPHHWPKLPRNTANIHREFSSSGEISVPGESFARDSPYALYLSSVQQKHGDPGRYLAEHRKEAKLRSRGFLVAWNQVEFHQLFPSDRAMLYPRVPADWAEWEVPISMYVPLPPVLSYAGSGLLTTDSPLWAIFFTEWTVLVFSRWVTDAYHRGLLWHLPPRVRAGIRTLYIPPLLQGSPFASSTLEGLFRLHDDITWGVPGSVANRSGAVPIQPWDGRFRFLQVPISPLRAFGDNVRIEEEVGDEFMEAEGGTKYSAAPSVVGGDRGNPFRSRPLEGSVHSRLSPARSPEPGQRNEGRMDQADEQGRYSSGPSPRSGTRTDLDLSAAYIEEWMVRLGVFDALDSYFPTGQIREEDLVRAYAQLLTERDRLQIQVSQAEIRAAERERGLVKDTIAREQAFQQLARLHEDLGAVMARLSSKKTDGSTRGQE